MGEVAAYEDETAEARRVELWRRRRFLELGFDRGQAQLLAWGGIDWHDAARLIAAGCPVQVAFDLLV